MANLAVSYKCKLLNLAFVASLSSWLSTLCMYNFFRRFTPPGNGSNNKDSSGNVNVFGELTTTQNQPSANIATAFACITNISCSVWGLNSDGLPLEDMSILVFHIDPSMIAAAVRFRHSHAPILAMASSQRKWFWQCRSNLFLVSRKPLSSDVKYPINF